MKTKCLKFVQSSSSFYSSQLHSIIIPDCYRAKFSAIKIPTKRTKPRTDCKSRKMCSAIIIIRCFSLPEWIYVQYNYSGCEMEGGGGGGCYLFNTPANCYPLALTLRLSKVVGFALILEPRGWVGW